MAEGGSSHRIIPRRRPVEAESVCWRSRSCCGTGRLALYVSGIALASRNHNKISELARSRKRKAPWKIEITMGALQTYTKGPARAP